MKIAFVRPTIGLKSGHSYRSRVAMEPYVFALLAGMTPDDVELSLYDERVEAIPALSGYDLVAMTVDTFTARRAYQLATAFRRQGIPVLLGGFHPSLCPDEAAQYADAVAIGEGEALWQEVLNDLRHGQLKPVYRVTQRMQPTRADRRLFHGKRYLPVTVTEFTRGCIHRCDFCSVHRMYPQPRTRTVTDIIQEIEEAGRHTVIFVDDNIIAVPDAARELCLALKPMRLRWMSQATLAVADNPRLLKLMAASGCVGLLIGLESLSFENMQQMGKGGQPDRYTAALRTLKDSGLFVYGSFLFGYDHDTPECFDRTVDFTQQQQLFLAGFNMLQPFPGTSLYARLQAEGRLISPRWWLDAAFRWGRAAFHPARMSAEELAAGCWQARKHFYQPSSVLRRGLDMRVHLRNPRNALFYLAGNLLSRQDVLDKRALPLGDDAMTLEEYPCLD